MTSSFSPEPIQPTSKPEVPPSLEADYQNSEATEAQEKSDPDAISQAGSTPDDERSVADHQIYIANLHAG